MKPPRNAPIAHPQAKMAIKEEAAKSEKPISCSHIVKKTIAFQGVDPTIPCNTLRDVMQGICIISLSVLLKRVKTMVHTYLDICYIVVKREDPVY